MTRLVHQALDSYRLAQYAVQAPCYICGTGNNYDAELCRYCQAPMALAHQANTQKIHPRMVAAIGASGAGKTVYLGMLMDILSRENQPLQLLARGAFSITLQQNTMAALSRCEFPAKTPNEPDRWNWVHCQVRSAGQRRPTELIMPDMAGEAILEEIDHPHTYPAIRSLLNKCGGIMLLVDAAEVGEGTKEQDFVSMKILSYLCELDDNRKTGWQQRPVALVFTKADESEGCFDNPAEYARRHTPGLWQHCQERFRRHEFFATGVAGACAHRIFRDGSKLRIPLRVEPRGIIEPFAWLLNQVHRRR